jgi:hypothetical protein
MSIFRETDFMHCSCPYDAGPIIIIPVAGDFLFPAFPAHRREKDRNVRRNGVEIERYKGTLA